ncbi:MAG: hypothetical protein RI925_52 [Pseudomonadota bacterium]|jgi:hypothetical protein
MMRRLICLPYFSPDVTASLHAGFCRKAKPQAPSFAIIAVFGLTPAQQVTGTVIAHVFFSFSN